MFATAPVTGNKIVFEYFSPAHVQAFPRIRITKVVHGYKHLFKPKASSSGSCNIDVACKDGAGWHDQARSVAVILTDNNSKYCTGAMVNNLREDGKQYFLTVCNPRTFVVENSKDFHANLNFQANHCTGWNDMKTHLVMFNYERQACGVDDSNASSADTAHGLNLLGMSTV